MKQVDSKVSTLDRIGLLVTNYRNVLNQINEFKNDICNTMVNKCETEWLIANVTSRLRKALAELKSTSGIIINPRD